MNTTAVLNAAADLVWQHGWTRGCAGWTSSPWHTGRLCVEGALGVALGGVPRPTVQKHPAYRVLQNYLGDKFLWHWNDTVPAEAVDVVQALRAAALIEAARESVSA